MTLNNLTNLYEVTKTIKFELKPTKNTHQRIQGWYNQGNTLSDPLEQYVYAKILAKGQERVIESIRNRKEGEQTYASKQILKIISPDYYYAHKNIGANFSLGKILGVDSKNYSQEFAEKWYAFLEESIDKINYQIGELDSLTVNVSDHNKPSHTAILHHLKPLCLQILYNHEFIKNLTVNHLGFAPIIKEEIRLYVHYADDHFSRISGVWRKTSEYIGEELYGTTVNHKAINKKTDLTKVQSEIDDLKKKFVSEQKNYDNINESFIKYDSEFRQENVVDNKNPIFDCWNFSNKEYSEFEKDKASKEYKSIKKNNPTYQTKLKEKNNASRALGDAKQKLNQYIQQVANQKKLHYLNKIVRSDNKYYVILIPRDSSIFLTTSDSSKYQVLDYHSLTFKALMKLVFERNIVGRVPADIEKIRVSKLYKKSQKNKKNNESISEEEKEYLHILTNFLIEAVDIINREQEDDRFMIPGFKVDNDYRNIDKFVEHINKSCYQISWKNIDHDQLIKLDKEGYIYMFQLFNKDYALDENCILNEEEQKKSERRKEKRGADMKQKDRTLFTDYRLDSLNEYVDHVRLNPESRIWLRVADDDCDSEPYVDPKTGIIKPNKHYFNKLLIDFQLMFYPNQKQKKYQVEKTIVDNIKKQDKQYYIGIDRGENQLATYCLIDQEKNLVLENGKTLMGDLTLVASDKNKKSRFIEESDCILGNNPYKNERINQLIVENKEKTGFILSDRYFDKKYCQIPLKLMPHDMLLEIKGILEKNFDPKYLKITTKEGYKVYDYGYAFTYSKTINKILYHLKITDPNNQNMTEIGKRELEFELMKSIKIKKGYTALFTGFITELTEKYGAFVIFEDMNNSSRGTKNQMNFLSEYEDTKYEFIDTEDDNGNIISSEIIKEKNDKTKNIEAKKKSMNFKEMALLKGISAYQMIENALIHKLGYTIQTNDDNRNGRQYTPKNDNIKNIVDSKNEGKNQFSHRGIVNYINANSTSQRCLCGFDSGDAGKIKWENNILTYEYDKKPYKQYGFAGLDDRMELLNCGSIDKKTGEKLQNIPDKKYLSIRAGKIYPVDNHTISDQAKKILKKGGDPIVCVHCGFDTRHNIIPIDDPDRSKVSDNLHKLYTQFDNCDFLAAYTIAIDGIKKVAETIIKKPIEKTPIQSSGSRHQNKNHEPRLNSSIQDTSSESSLKSNIKFTSVKKS